VSRRTGTCVWLGTEIIFTVEDTYSTKYTYNQAELSSKKTT